MPKMISRLISTHKKPFVAEDLLAATRSYNIRATNIAIYRELRYYIQLQHFFQETSDISFAPPLCHHSFHHHRRRRRRHSH